MTEDKQSSDEESHHSEEEDQPETENVDNEDETVTFKELVCFLISLQFLTQ